MNLLNVKLIRNLFASQWFPLVPQAMTLVAFGLIITGGWGVSTSDAAFAKVLRNTNLSNLLVWSYWWPVIIVIAILIGRVWCTVCPMELVSTFATRIGLRRKVPGFFKSGWVITIFFTLILLVGIHTLSIHRLPHRMVIYMLMLLGVALVCGLVFEKRAFCSYVCPVGHLLGLYAMISPFEWRADDMSICRACKTRDCSTKKNYYRLVGHSCTSNISPPTIKDNRDCLLCTQCLKVCPHKNIRFSTRKPYADFFRGIELKNAQAAFVLLVSGFVVYEILSEWSKSKTILMWAPNQLIETLGITGSAVIGFFSATVLFVIYPVILFSAVVVLSKLLSRTSAGGIAIARTFALLLIPTMAAGHLIKAVLKMTSRIPYWNHVFADPTGRQTAQRIFDSSLLLDKSIPDALFPIISYTTAGILLIALAATIIIFRKSSTLQKYHIGVKIPLFLGALAYWSVFAVMIFMWRFCS